jgi:hypothetical protein
MKWTLLVPGALLPAALAPELARAIRAPLLVQHLLGAQRGPELAAGEHSDGAPHWSWLARAFGQATEPPVTAPYAWHADGPGDAATRDCWIAHCEPVHMAIARDHFTVTDLGDDPLQTAEAARLFELAGEALAPPADAGLRFAERGGRWFLLSERPLDLLTFGIDTVLGRSAHERLPAGADARRWRVLSNEIQMRWHASEVNAAREERGARAVNAVWIHGGGRWHPLPGGTVGALHADPGGAEAEILRGWMHAAGAHKGRDALSLHRGLFAAHAHQAWESWLGQLDALALQIDRDLASARAAGARRFELVLCGAQTARSLALPLDRSWWTRWRGAPRDPARLLQRLLGEHTADGDGGTGTGTLAA